MRSCGPAQRPGYTDQRALWTSTALWWPAVLRHLCVPRHDDIRHRSPPACWDRSSPSPSRSLSPLSGQTSRPFSSSTASSVTFCLSIKCLLTELFSFQRRFNIYLIYMNIYTLNAINIKRYTVSVGYTYVVYYLNAIRHYIH